MTFEFRSSPWEMGVGNLPAVVLTSVCFSKGHKQIGWHTFRETGTQETGDLLDQSVGGKEGVVLASKLLDELLILVQFLQVVGRHGIDAVMLRAVDVVLITKNAESQLLSVSRTIVACSLGTDHTRRSCRDVAHEEA